jgi:signal transduction histidine kinase
MNASVARLRSIIVTDTVTTLAAALFMIVVNTAVVRDGYLTILTVAVAATGLVMASGLPCLRRGRVTAALLRLAIANWGVAVVVALIATFAWPVMIWTALLPTVVAASFIGGRELATYVATSVLVALAVVLVGLLQDFSGFSDRVDEWVRDTILIVTAPGRVAVVALMAWHNSTSMQTMLADVTASRGELAEQANELRRSRARVVAATDRERRRIERDLHDTAQQRLIGIGIGLSRAKALYGTDPAAAATMLDTLRSELRYAHDELRDLAQGVYPPVLTEHGLEAALHSVADRSSVPVTFDLNGFGRHAPGVEAALYFCSVEAIQNVAKHAAATTIVLGGGRDEDEVWLTVADDGRGFDAAVASPGSGIVGIQDRLGSMGGRFAVTSSGHGTTVRFTVPSTPPSFATLTSA